MMSVRFSLCSLTAVCRNQMYMGKKHDEHEVIDKMSTAGHNSWCYSMDRQSKQRNSDDQSKAGESELHFAGDSQVHASSPQVSSTAETPSCSVASNSDCNNHVRDHGEPRQQTCVPGIPGGDDRKCPQTVVSPFLQAPFSDASGTSCQGSHQPCHSPHADSQASNGSDDPRGRSRRDGSDSRYGDQYGSGKESEAHGKGVQSQVQQEGQRISQIQNVDQCGQLRSDLRVQPTEPQVKGIELLSDGQAMLLRADAQPSGVSQGGSKLHAEVLYRCPKPYPQQTQCDYFAWTEDTKAEEYEKLYAQNASTVKSPLPKPTKKKSKHVSETDSNTSSGDGLDLAQSPASASPKTPPRAARCQHEWNRRGTNAYINMKTCHLCGLQETFATRTA